MNLVDGAARARQTAAAGARVGGQQDEIASRDPNERFRRRRRGPWEQLLERRTVTAADDTDVVKAKQQREKERVSEHVRTLVRDIADYLLLDSIMLVVR